MSCDFSVEELCSMGGEFLDAFKNGDASAFYDMKVRVSLGDPPEFHANLPALIGSRTEDGVSVADIVEFDWRSINKQQLFEIFPAVSEAFTGKVIEQETNVAFLIALAYMSFFNQEDMDKMFPHMFNEGRLCVFVPELKPNLCHNEWSL